jgi:hypothetical protein
MSIEKYNVRFEQLTRSCLFLNDPDLITKDRSPLPGTLKGLCYGNVKVAMGRIGTL